MIISIVSANGGTGKTTSAANIGISLAKMGKKTVLPDPSFSYHKILSGALTHRTGDKTVIFLTLYMRTRQI